MLNKQYQDLINLEIMLHSVCDLSTDLDRFIKSLSRDDMDVLFDVCSCERCLLALNEEKTRRITNSKKRYQTEFIRIGLTKEDKKAIIGVDLLKRAQGLSAKVEASIYMEPWDDSEVVREDEIHTETRLVIRPELMLRTAL